MKLIIAGSRSIKDLRAINQGIKHCIDNNFITSPLSIQCIVSGTANGVDKLGETYARLNDIPVKQFPANWSDISTDPVKVKYNQYGPYNALAGFNRNKQMAEFADAALIVWDGKSSGSKDMIECMYKLNKPVIVCKPNLIEEVCKL